MEYDFCRAETGHHGHHIDAASSPGRLFAKYCKRDNHSDAANVLDEFIQSEDTITTPSRSALVLFSCTSNSISKVAKAKTDRISRRVAKEQHWMGRSKARDGYDIRRTVRRILYSVYVNRKPNMLNRGLDYMDDGSSRTSKAPYSRQV